MTCEILVMNRNAVVLAADSAVTVTKRSGAGTDRRYFKNVNKVFQLSEKAPIGIMVYGAGDIQQAPWELVIKEYRTHLGDKSFPKVADYAEDFFKFIQNSYDIFPVEYRKELLVDSCVWTAAVFLDEDLIRDEAFQSAQDKLAYSTAKLDFFIERADEEDFLEGFVQEDVDAAITSFVDNLVEKLLAAFDGTDRLNNIPVEKLAEFAIKAVYKWQSDLASSGIVISGFGDNDYFPSFYQYTCYGNLNDKVAYKKEDSQFITYHNHSHIKAFAMNDMANTFLLGLSNRTYESSVKTYMGFARNLLLKHLQNPPQDFEKAIETEAYDFGRALLRDCAQKNYQPLTEIVASFPIEDMADLAETLVRLESLKEKVTQPTESVGGPVDVAVITRAQGLVWIKRKHYFSAELNSRYFSRQVKT